MAGRPKGSRNKRTASNVRAGTKEGISPLDFLLNVMRSECPPELQKAIKAGEIDETVIHNLNAWYAKRIDAAKSAAPYVHPKLSQVEAKVDGNLTIEVVNFADTDTE